jgi:hypothetical protein
MAHMAGILREEFLDRPVFPTQSMRIAMNIRIIPTLPLLAASLLFISCEAPDPAAARQNVAMERENEAAAAILPRVTTPGWRAQGGGKPFLDVTGYSRVSYVKDGSPDDVVEVFYHGKDNPRVDTDSPESVTIMGRKVQTYASGNEDPAFATQPILLTAPDGKSAYYSFQFHNGHLYKTREIPQFGW